jgi:phenol 2-monooxygenase
MVRLYIELDKLRENERISRDNITPEYLIAAANRIVQPYTLDVQQVAWWSVYEIGQRLTTAFDDAEPDRLPRVFLAGDACHTHSPKAGQGLNTSVNDTWNLGWKLAHVLTGRARPELLSWYSAERQNVAQQLIDFDREFSKMFSARPKSADHPDGVDPAEFQKYFQLFGRFTAGTAIRYNPSNLVGNGENQDLAKGQTLGMRFHSAPVIRHADARPMQLGHCVAADGRWHIFAFAGREQPMAAGCRLTALCEFLANEPNSPLLKHTPPGADIDAVIDLRAIFQQHHRDIAAESIHPLLAPRKGRFALHDYEKVFCPDLNNNRDIFDMRGIDRDQGCIIIVRPDQYVANVLKLDDYAGLTSFFAEVLIEV